MSAERAPAVLALLALLLAGACLVALKTGQADITWLELWRILLGGDGARATAHGSIMLQLRLPRMLLGLGAGAALATAGVVFQAILRNPLADPYLLGLSGGASIGAAAVLMGPGGWGHTPLLPVAAFLGSLAALLVVTKIAELSAAPGPTTLILAGVMVSAFCSALVMFLSAVSSSARVHGTMLWLMGSLAAPPQNLLPLFLAVTAGAVVMLALTGHTLNALSMGDEVAAHLGVHTRRASRLYLVTAALLTGLAVATCGLIGFVGLVVPHAVRSIAGADHRFLIPASALAGAGALILADSGSRLILPPAEIPVGVVTALVGAPFFLLLLLRRRGWMG
jgi:iron complex transport system permease protein